MSSRKRTSINLICSFLVLGTSLCVNFVMSPYIVASIGVEANGFVTLAENFTTYLSLVVLALNSMAARFISIEYNRKNYQKANAYYNSIFWGNLILCALLMVVALFILIRLEVLIQIPAELVPDVKLLMTFVFFSFFVVTAAPNWECGVFVSNRLDRQYIPNVVTSLLRCLILFLMFSLLTPNVWYVGFSTAVITVINLLVNGYNTHRLTPELHIELKKGKRICSFPAIRELLAAGIWNSVTSVGWMLLSGLDLLVSNIFIGPVAMGMVSLSKILYNLMTKFSNSITNVTTPALVKEYATGSTEKFAKNVKKWVKITSVLTVVPLVGIMVLSEPFFSLWVPGQDARLLANLSTIACGGYVVTCGCQVLFKIFTVTNQLKAYSIMTLASGVVSTLVVLMSLNTSFGAEYGVYFVVGTSTVISAVRNIFITIPWAAQCIGCKRTEFYPVNFRCFINVLICVFISSLLRNFTAIDNWITFLVMVCVLSVANLVVSCAIVLNKEERGELFGLIGNRIKKARKKFS